MEVEDCWRFSRPCIWINRPFTRIRVSANGALAVAASALEAEDGCVPGGAVVVREVNSGGVRRHCHIGLIQRSGEDEVICFCMIV